MAPKFASEVLVGTPNFASKNIGDRYPKFCPLNLRFDPKIRIFSQLLSLAVTEFPQGGGNSHRLGYEMCHFSRVLFQLENKFLGQDFSLE